MLTRVSLLLCFLCALVLSLACGKTEVTVNRNDSTPPAAKTSQVSTPVPTHSSVNNGPEKIGVPECDDFIAAYDACVSSKVPEVARAQYKTAIEQWRTSWKKLAENPNTKATLAAACKQSAEQARVSMKTYNCTF